MLCVKCDDDGLEKTAEALLSGAVAVIPTDTVYGLAAHPGKADAVERLYSIKGRDRSKPIALLASGFEAAAAFAGGITGKAAEMARARWPGAFTLVVGAEGFRVPDHEWTRKLLEKCGGLLRVTSANISGESPAVDAQSAVEQVGRLADVVVDGGRSPGGVPSSVVRVFADGGVEILRP